MSQKDFKTPKYQELNHASQSGSQRFHDEMYDPSKLQNSLFINSPEVDMINFFYSESIDIMKKYSIDPKQMADYVNNCSTSERDL